MQKAVALSSAEAEGYAINRSVAEALGVQSSAADFRVAWRVVVHTDAPAAVWITRRRGGGKLKHIVAQEFWLYGVVQGGRAELRKVGRGSGNT